MERATPATKKARDCGPFSYTIFRILPYHDTIVMQYYIRVIRVNKKFRICFAWIDRYAINVELTDYH
jgi:hypothetical protein